MKKYKIIGQNLRKQVLSMQKLLSTYVLRLSSL